MKLRFSFEIACFNTDNGSEKFQKENIFHFYSDVGGPTDNPWFEKSFLVDDLEFYQRGGFELNFY